MTEEQARFLAIYEVEPPLGCGTLLVPKTVPKTLLDRISVILNEVGGDLAVRRERPALRRYLEALADALDDGVVAEAALVRLADAVNEEERRLATGPVRVTDDGGDQSGAENEIVSALSAPTGPSEEVMADKQYTVTWSYDCCVGSPEEAARLASEVMRSGSDHGGHTQVVVECEDGTSCDVDLAKLAPETT